ncbi:MAG: phosphodiester glycosidase family protein [Treponema sp.]|nr:phosphodiester glycosidase family protein [Treponema sp.]
MLNARPVQAGQALCLYKDKLQLTLLIILSILHISCASVLPVFSNAAQPAFHSSIEDIEPVWQPVSGGIDYFHGKIESPRLEFWALQIDLSSANIGIIVKGGNTDSHSILSTRVTSFVRDNDLIAGINAVPFDIVSSTEGQPIKNSGLVISGGELISPLNPFYDAIVFYKDGRAAITSQSSIRSVENIENAAGGFHQILAGGQAAQRTNENSARHPRSAAGLSDNGMYLYLLVIDGRRAGSIGSTEKETALLLRALGSWDGINFDGGGSSALAMRSSDGNVRAVNTPVHRIQGQERAVAGCLGIKVAE